MLSTYRHSLLIGALLFGVCQSVQAQPETVGQIILASGQLQANQPNQTPRSLKRGSPFFAHDTLTTSNNSEAQLRFTDGTLVSLRPNSAFKIDQYKFSNAPAADHKNTTVDYTVSLVKGGLRSISGEIAKKDPNAYQINAGVATIGVRGTEFSLVLDQAGGLGAAAYAGRISVKNQGGSIEIGKGAEFNYAYVASAYKAPQGEPIRPSFMLNDPQIGQVNSGSSRSSICLQ